MRSNKLSGGLVAVLAVFTAILVVGTGAAAQTERILHDFADNGTDGYETYSGLIFDGAGNLYGTTLEGGTNKNCYDENIGCGTVFELSPNGSGGWTQTILHDFGSGSDGRNPDASLVFDAAGNLYGTTLYGGTGVCNGVENACGTVFELVASAGGGWTEKVLYSFGGNGTDGYVPSGSLIFDAAGNLYGTTGTGGVHGLGTVFELSPAEGGGWTEKMLHSFTGTDGSSPLANLIFDAVGNLYGTTWAGGSHKQAGTVFELMPTRASGGWTIKTLHDFGGGSYDGAQPHAGLIFDAAGNLYSTTQTGGTGACGFPGCGTVFELSATTGGRWTSTILHNFDNNDADGYEPLAGLTLDHEGKLYGTTFVGGTGACKHSGCGTVFELEPAAGGGWTETVLYSFPGYTAGYWPASSLIFDSRGNLYGTTVNGGTDTGAVAGTVFEIVP
jgi:uncharacterized repeat protein (TIGR03803 family)